MLEVTPQDLVSITIPIAVLFLVLFAGLKRTLFLPALERLNDLDGKVRSLSKQAQDSQAQARALRDQVQSGWNRAKESAIHQRDAALVQADHEADALLEKARSKVLDINARGRVAAGEQTARLRKDLLPQVTQWADDLVEKVLNI